MSAVYDVNGREKRVVSMQLAEVQVTPTVTASVYTALFCLGGLQTIVVPSAQGYIESVKLSDKAKQNSIVAVTFFNANPTNSTFTDRAAMAINAADIAKLIGTITINNFVSYSVISLGEALAQHLSYTGLTANTIYAQAMTLGTPTPASTSDYTFSYGVEYY